MSPTLTTIDVRDAILDAAGRLLARYGYKKMTMDDLAREAGIGKGTTYLHFPSKQEVVLSRIDRLVDRLLEQLRHIAIADLRPSEKLRRMLVLRILYRFDSVRGYAHSLDEELRAIRPAYLARRRRYFTAEAAVLADVLRTPESRAVFDFKDPLVIAHTLLLATNSLLPYSLSRRELGRRKEVEAHAGRIADLLLNGLRRRSE